MRITTISQRLIVLCAVFGMVGGELVCRAQNTSRVLTNQDKSEIVESALRLAFGSRIWLPENVSSENVEFADASRLARLGFVLLDVRRIQKLRTDQFVDYVVFQRIVFEDGVVTASLLQVKERHPCFGRASSSERKLTYEFRRDSGQWLGQLVYRPRLEFSGNSIPWPKQQFLRGTPDNFKSGIAGRTTDPNGAVVVGARITITRRSTKMIVNLKSNDQGEYVADLDPDVYDVEADADGFKRITRKAIPVLRESRSFVDFVLEPKPPFDHDIVR